MIRTICDFSRRHWGHFGLLWFALAWLCVAPVQAQTVITAIRVEGSQRIEAETVRTYMTLKIGQLYSEAEANASIKALFASGLFADVSIRRDGPEVIVRVVENPIINRVVFEGNRRITAKTLQSESRLQPREIYTRKKVQDVVERFVELYRRSGRFGARVEPKIIQLPQNRVDVVFEIREGGVTKVRAINFIGNDRYGDYRLRQEIATRQSSWFRLFSSADNYDPDRLNYDKELLRRFYLRKGYADFRVVSAVAELSPRGDDFFITFTVEEGPRYRFTQSEVISRLPLEDIGFLERGITHKSGQNYDAAKIDETIDNMRAVLGERGFAFADVQPRVTRNRADNNIEVNYAIEEGERVYVERIDIAGNTRTQDRVIRRQMRIDEGDAFNRLLMTRAERDIRGLGFFSKVDISNYPGDEDDTVVVDIAVAEQSTGELTLGVGYSSSESVRGDVSIAERNFLGRGQTVRLSSSFSEDVQYFNGSFTEPYFLNRDLAASLSAFHSVSRYRTQRHQTTNRTGSRVDLGFPLSPDSRFAVYVLASLVDFNDTLTPRNSYKNFRLETGYTYTIDKRDDRINPTAGWDFVFGQDISGPSDGVSFLRTTAVADLYQELLENWVLRLRAGAGHIFNYESRPVLYSDRFFRGGLTFRGFERLGVGPRDRATGNALGANIYAIGTAELSFPLGLPRELGLKTVFFVDAGWLGETDETEDADAGEPDNIQDDFAFRASYGISIGWRSPLGPVQFDLSRIIRKADYDRTKFFRFSIGTTF